jgi:DNA replication protein DnaC
MPYIFETADYDRDVPEPLRKVLEGWTLRGDYIIDEKKKQASVFIWGPAGSGKTHVSIAIKRRLDKKNYNGFTLLINYTDMIAELTQKNTESLKLDDISKHRGLLIIDDLGAKSPNDYAVDTLYRILNYRYEWMMPTLITSNLTLDTINQVFGDRISSRIDRMCVIYQLA